MKLHKTILTIMASAMILGLGANIPQASVSAHHIRTYKVRRHARRRPKRSRWTWKTRAKRRYTKKHAKRYARKHTTKRTKSKRSTRSKKSKLVYSASFAKRSRKHGKRVSRARRRVAKRTPRKHYRHHASYAAHNAYKSSSSHGRSMYSYFTKAQIAHFAKLNQEPISEFMQENKTNNNGHIYGPAKAYNLGGYYAILTPAGLAYYAKINHTTVPKAVKTYVKHATKYWTWNGAPTKLDYQEANQDAINDLNHDREAQGLNPLQPNADLQFIAEQRSHQMYEQSIHQYDENPDQSPIDPITGEHYSLEAGGHSDDNANNNYKGYSYNYEIAKEHGMPTSMSENMGVMGSVNYNTPSQIADEENNMWDEAHQSTRMYPGLTQVGISTNDGGAIEEFQ